MGFADSSKQVLIRHNQEQYRAFTLNHDANLIMPKISLVPWISSTEDLLNYHKTILPTGQNPTEETPHLKFITKGKAPHGFVWKTHAKTLKNAVRWGIVQTHSMTGKVIAALGEYRVAAHERIAKGMVSNSQAIKLKLLDLFQERFEALQALESMVNKDNNLQDYEVVIAEYVKKLNKIKQGLESHFSNITESGFDNKTRNKIALDIDADIARAKAYRNSINQNNLRAHNRNRGSSSIMSLVQEQMIHNLYELQGINQDISFSNQRYFALTRGELNDYIENARRIVDDYPIDPRNAITPAHHGLYSNDDNELITYDFAEDQLTPHRERSVLLAISFIEGWDRLKNHKNEPTVIENDSGIEILDTIAATRWKRHRNAYAFLKSMGYYFLNIFKGMVISTRPWEEESWTNPNFHLYATKLRQLAKLNEPLWKKPAHFFKNIIYSIRDLFNGASDIGTGISIRMPQDLLNDWQSTKNIPLWEEIDKATKIEFDDILSLEKTRLMNVLPHGLQDAHEISLTLPSHLAQVEYALSSGEQNGVFSLLVKSTKGLNDVAEFISLHLFAKDPIGGLFFSSAYVLGVAAIYYPSMTSSVFGASYVQTFSNYAHSIASSDVVAALSGSFTQAELVAVTWDGVEHGPSGVAIKTLRHIGEDPLTTASLCAAVYGLGYVLVNGIAGYEIPYISKHVKAGLGTKPELTYPSIGLKSFVLLHEAMKTEKSLNIQDIKLSYKNHGPENSSIGNLADQFYLSHWLSKNATLLPKLSPNLLFSISRHIDRVFNKEDAESLQKLLYPEPHLSVAFQLISSPLSYIPAIFRLGVASILSFSALCTQQPHPEQPIKRATIELMHKLKKELTQLIVITNALLYFPYRIMSTLLKTPAFLFTLVIGRLAGLMNVAPGHAIYGAFGAVHHFFKRVGEFFCPARILKGVTVAHPNHTLLKINHSYLKLLQTMSKEKDLHTTKAGAELPPIHFSFPLVESRVKVRKDSQPPLYIELNRELNNMT